MMFKVSIVIPTYNPGAYINDCLESLFSQTVPLNFYEVIIVLNGDISNLSEEYIRNILEKSPSGFNYRLLISSEKGVSNARNIGIDASLGEYIGFVDDDDIVSNDYIENLLKVSNKTTVGMSHVYSFIKSPLEKRTNFFICNKINNSSFLKRKSHYFNRSFLAFPVGKLIHRDMISNRRFDVSCNNGEDALFMTTISDRIHRLSIINAVYYVREREGSASRKPIPMSKVLLLSFLLIFKYIKVYFKNPLSYNLFLFLARIPGVLKNGYYLLKNK